MKTGYISEIIVRPTKFGNYYDIMIDGKKLGAGKFEPKGVAKGDYVQYEVDMNGQYENLRPGTLSKVAAPAGSVAPALSQPGSMDRQEIISRQAALNSAIAFLNILAANNAIPAGKALKTDVLADKLEAILMAYTTKFYRLATGTEYELPDDVVVDSLNGAADLGVAE